MYIKLDDYQRTRSICSNSRSKEKEPNFASSMSGVVVVVVVVVVVFPGSAVSVCRLVEHYRFYRNLSVNEFILLIYIKTPAEKCCET